MDESRDRRREEPGDERPREGNADARFLVPDEQDAEREEPDPTEPGRTGSGAEPRASGEGRP